VLTRLTPETQTERQAPAGYGAQAGYPPPQQPYPSAVVGVEDRMTVDDVVVRTVGLLALTAISGGAAWLLAETQGWTGRTVGTVWVSAMLIGLVLGLVISFTRATNPVLMAVYAVVEGVFLGMVSMAYESAYSGIVVQAVLATFGVFFLMALLYKSRVIRATPRFNRIIFGCLAGAAVVIIGNLLLSFFGVNTPLNGNGPVALLFAAAMVVLGALSFVTDFDLVEQGVAAGLPKKDAWVASFGLLVGLIFVYIYVIRLLGILRSN
jgi:uncharacterized YccA/Bax inhibitor family protein